MKDKTVYELTPAQDVVHLQGKLSLHKNVYNIMATLTVNEKLDFELLKKAFNKVVERNDCLRIKFFKEKKQLKQIFEDTREYDIPVLSFNSEVEQEKYLQKSTKKVVGFLNSRVVEPAFINTFDGKSMVVLKVCHLVLDIYGINMIYKDLFDVYNALKSNSELPPVPTSFEEMVKTDIKKRHDETYNQKNREFFNEYFSSRENPYYAGIHGTDNPIWQKQLKNNRHAMKLFIINNQTQGYAHKIEKSLVDKVFEFCKQNNITPANFLFYALSITASKMNGNVKNMLPMELCNCRGTVATKKGAGTKAQSILCYTTVNYDKTFKENLTKFCEDQNVIYRHIGFSDLEVQELLHKHYKSSYLEIYYGIAYSFVPVNMPKGSSFMVRSNGHGALPCYIAQLYNIEDGNITMAYDVQTKIISEQNVELFHKNYLTVLEEVVSNPNIDLNKIEF